MIRWITKNLGGSKAPEIEKLKEWKKENIDLVINLLEGSYGKFLFEQQKKYFEVIHFPLGMYSQIEIDEIVPIYEYINEKINRNKKVVVHCKLGIARSGTFLAGYLIYTGKSYNEALDMVISKKFFPETSVQIKFLKDLEKWVKDERTKF
jgi:protein-tyrosine phosphatase